MPASIEPSFQGTAHAFESSLANESTLILAAMVTVYLVLGVLYESFIHPITILSTLPSAGVGAILALIRIQERSGCHCADRDHSADRHREEERHHDDRLCAGSGAQGRETAGGSHLPGVPAALPSDHDDHHGRAAGRRSAGLWQRRGFRIAKTARHLHHRRTADQPGADAVHYSGDLLVFRTGRGLGRPAPRLRESEELLRARIDRKAGAYEHFHAIHREARRHDAAAGGGDARRRDRLIRYYPSRHCRRSTSPPSWSAPACREPVPMSWRRRWRLPSRSSSRASRVLRK